ncbi:MAG: DUF3105 domain-containing protein [Anaerolineae bacterium]|nr:DUF3105 domain-containing protein [Anaerolineae bacterium]
MSKRQQAKQRRDINKRRRWMIIGAVVLLFIAAGVALFISQRENPDVQKFGSEGNTHIEEEPQTYIWDTRPPTSGPHAPTIANWGIHDETVPEWYQVHNLEDGGVILHYNCPEGCPEIVEELEDIVEEVGRERIILQPYPEMDSKIAVTAWTRLLTLEEVDRNQILAFVNDYRGIDNH